MQSLDIGHPSNHVLLKLFSGCCVLSLQPCVVDGAVCRESGLFLGTFSFSFFFCCTYYLKELNFYQI